MWYVICHMSYLDWYIAKVYLDAHINLSLKYMYIHACINPSYNNSHRCLISMIQCISYTVYYLEQHPEILCHRVSGYKLWQVFLLVQVPITYSRWQQYQHSAGWFVYVLAIAWFCPSSNPTGMCQILLFMPKAWRICNARPLSKHALASLQPCHTCFWLRCIFGTSSGCNLSYLLKTWQLKWSAGYLPLQSKP